MSNEVQFDIDQIQHTSFKPKEPTLVRLVIKYSGGFAKDEKQANYILLGFSILAIVTAFIIPSINGSESTLTHDQIERVFEVTGMNPPVVNR